MTQASEDLRAAAEQAIAEVHELPQSIGQKILGAIDRLTTAFVTQFEAVTAELAESKKREIELHDCVDRLEKRVVNMEERMAERERAHFQQHSEIHEGIGSLRGEVRGLADVLGDAAGVARTEAIAAANRAEAAERYVRGRTFAESAERPSEPAIPSRRHPVTLPGSPAFESDAPPGVKQ